MPQTKLQMMNTIKYASPFPGNVWVPLMGFEVDYVIANCGCVFSLRTSKRVPTTTVNGYLKIRINNSGRIHHLRVNRLVAFQFVDNNQPGVFDIVNHKDLIKNNNHYSNLEWTDHAGNMRHYHDSKTY